MPGLLDNDGTLMGHCTLFIRGPDNGMALGAENVCQEQVCVSRIIFLTDRGEMSLALTQQAEWHATLI